MKRFLNLALIAVVLLSLGAKPQTDQEAKLKEGRDKILETCLNPDSPRPIVEAKFQRNAVLCGKAISLPKPSYPKEAKVQEISGSVSVEVVIDEQGRVEWAKAVEGHPLLRTAAVEAACQARYSPTTVSGRMIKTQSVIGYMFVNK